MHQTDVRKMELIPTFGPACGCKRYRTSTVQQPRSLKDGASDLTLRICAAVKADAQDSEDIEDPRWTREPDVKRHIDMIPEEHRARANDLLVRSNRILMQKR